MNCDSLDSVQDETTALYIAAQNGHLRVVELLIAARARVDIQQKVRFHCSYNCIVIIMNLDHAVNNMFFDLVNLIKPLARRSFISG